LQTIATSKIKINNNLSNNQKLNQMKSMIHENQKNRLQSLCKNSILAAAFSVTGLLNAQKVDLTVDMSGFQNDKGVVKVGLYNSEGTFLKTTFKSLNSKIKSKTAVVTFEGIEVGEYAVSIYQDENSNNKMDTNFFGIPNEPYMASNNTKGSFGPPKYEKAKFTLKENTKIAIKIN
jgi:uncharacterized protein (DUF2141 family)